jgi:hypothetical protein
MIEKMSFELKGIFIIPPIIIFEIIIIGGIIISICFPSMVLQMNL